VFPERLRSAPSLAVGLLAAVMAFAAILPQLHQNTWLFRDGRFYTNTAITLTESFSLDQTEFCASWYTGQLGWNRDLDPGWSNVALGRNGEHWPKHTWLLPLVASPLVYAFGLAGTLLFNLLMLGVIAAGLFRFARAYAPPETAACAAIAFVFGSAIVAQNAYDFSADVLLLAFFSQGLAALVEKNGPKAGILFALAVVMRPTTLMWLPPLAIIAGVEAGKKPLGRALAGGTVVLVLAGLMNTYLFGRPWWTGYQRTLVTVAGAPQMTSHVDLFSVPFDEGIVRVWSGEYGLRAAFTILLLALPGLFLLARKRWPIALAAVLGVGLSLAVFARYSYEGHRFHWAGLSFLVPALALGIELGARVPRLVLRARSAIDRRAHRASVIAGAAALAVMLTALPFEMPQGRLASGPLGHVVSDLLESFGMIELAAAAIAAIVHLLIGAWMVAMLTRIGARLVRPELAGAAAVVWCALPDVRVGVEAGGALLLIQAFAVSSLERISSGRRVAAAIFGALALGLALFTEEGARLFEHTTTAWSALSRAVIEQGPSRLALPAMVLAIAGTGIALLDARERRTSFAMAGLLGLALVPGLATTEVGYRPLATLLLAPGTAVALSSLAGLVALGLREDGSRRLAAGIGLVFTLLIGIGAVHRARAASAPFHMATYEGVRHALVYQDEPFHDDVPCDFLAWEHMGWECSHLDSGLFGMVGLALSGGEVTYGHVPEQMMLLPTGQRGQLRRVVWPHVRAGQVLALRWAVPDAHPADGTLRVLIDDQERSVIEVPSTDDGWVRWVRIDTPELVGRDVRLELTFRANARRPAVVGVDATW
jgi:hypothetical protein